MAEATFAGMIGKRKAEVDQSLSAYARTLDVPAFVTDIRQLVELQAYTEAAQREASSMRVIAQMWQVIRAAAADPTYIDDRGDRYCIYTCGGEVSEKKDWEFIHGPDCPHLLAKTLLALEGRPRP